MVKNEVRGDIFTTSDKHIIFAINTEGYNDSGFAGAVSRKYWPELANAGGNKFGEVLTKEAGDKTFYAIVCHSLEAKKMAGELLPKLLKKLSMKCLSRKLKMLLLLQLELAWLALCPVRLRRKFMKLLKTAKKPQCVYVVICVYHNS